MKIEYAQLIEAVRIHGAWITYFPSADYSLKIEEDHFLVIERKGKESEILAVPMVNVKFLSIKREEKTNAKQSK